VLVALGEVVVEELREEVFVVVEAPVGH
jgi:hypothetical protein